MVSSSPGPATKPGLACIIPSLISSRQIAGQPTARAISCASVVLPEPGGPLTTTKVGREFIQPLPVIKDGGGYLFYRSNALPLPDPPVALWTSAG